MKPTNHSDSSSSSCCGSAENTAQSSVDLQPEQPLESWQWLAVASWVPPSIAIFPRQGQQRTQRRMQTEKVGEQQGQADSHPTLKTHQVQLLPAKRYLRPLGRWYLPPLPQRRRSRPDKRRRKALLRSLEAIQRRDAAVMAKRRHVVAAVPVLQGGATLSHQG